MMWNNCLFWVLTRWLKRGGSIRTQWSGAFYLPHFVWISRQGHEFHFAGYRDAKWWEDFPLFFKGKGTRYYYGGVAPKRLGVAE